MEAMLNSSSLRRKEVVKHKSEVVNILNTILALRSLDIICYPQNLNNSNHHYQTSLSSEVITRIEKGEVFTIEKLNITSPNAKQFIPKHLNSFPPQYFLQCLSSSSTQIVDQHYFWIVRENTPNMCIGDLFYSENINSNLLNERIITSIIKHVLIGLESIHSQGVYHGCIFSCNLFINNNRDLIIGVPIPHIRYIETPYWFAPELFSGMEISCKSDVFSIGSLLFDLAEREPPYMEYPPIRAIFKLITEGLPALRSPNQWSHEFIDFYRQCGIADPVLRPSVSDLLSHPLMMNHSGNNDFRYLLIYHWKSEVIIMIRSSIEVNQSCDNNNFNWI